MKLSADIPSRLGGGDQSINLSIESTKASFRPTGVDHQALCIS